MSDSLLPEGTSDSHNENAKLAWWLQQVIKIPAKASPVALTQTTTTKDAATELALQFNSDYHITFYQQLPDFVMALLNKDSQATLRYAPLLYHLAGCGECHASYLDPYDAMRAAVQ